MKKVAEELPFWTAWICWTELLEVTSFELFGEIRNTRSITWAYYMREKKFSLKRYEITRTFVKYKFSFRPSK